MTNVTSYYGKKFSEQILLQKIQIKMEKTRNHNLYKHTKGLENSQPGLLYKDKISILQWLQKLNNK